jgi:hypothetical protein
MAVNMKIMLLWVVMPCWNGQHLGGFIFGLDIDKTIKEL